MPLRYGIGPPKSSADCLVCPSRQQLYFEHPPCVSEQEFAFNLFGAGQPAKGSDDVGALATRAATEDVVAIAAEHQFVLVLLEEPAGVVFVASKEIQTRAG